MDEESSRGSDDDPLSRDGVHEPQEKMNPIVCRMRQNLWWAIWLGAVESAFMFAGPFLPDSKHPSHSVWLVAVICWPVGIFMATSILGLALDLMHGEIRADAEGIMWRRGFAKGKSARWEEISDFHCGTDSRRRHTVETPSGKLELSGSFENIDQIADLVTERAINAPARAWEVKGFRRGEEWWLSLGYWTNTQRWFAPIMSLPGLLVIGVTGIAVLRGLPHKVVAPDLFSVLAFLLTVPFLFLVTGLFIYIPIMAWQERSFAWEHRNERLHLDAKGLKYKDGERCVVANWNQVINVSRVEAKGPIRFQIETENGDFIIWHLSNSAVWEKFSLVVSQYAPDALTTLRAGAKERLQHQRDLEGERGAWSGGEFGVGTRQWSFRSRETRFVFRWASFLLAFTPLLYVLLSYHSSGDDESRTTSWPVFAMLCALCALVIGAGWLWLARTEILADEEGLELRSPFHRARHVGWQGIEEVERDAWGEFVRAQGRKVYVVRLFAPVRRDELRKHIEGEIDARRGSR